MAFVGSLVLLGGFRCLVLGFCCCLVLLRVFWCFGLFKFGVFFCFGILLGLVLLGVFGVLFWVFSVWFGGFVVWLVLLGGF